MIVAKVFSYHTSTTCRLLLLLLLLLGLSTIFMYTRLTFLLCYKVPTTYPILIKLSIKYCPYAAAAACRSSSSLSACVCVS